MLAGLGCGALEVTMHSVAMRSWLVALPILMLACGERDAPAPPPALEAVPTSEAPAPAAPTAAQAAPAVPKAPPPRMPRGLVTNQPGATPSYVLFNPLLSDTSYLVDNEGRVVHVWKTAKALGYVPSDATAQDLELDFLHVNAVVYHGRLDQIALSVPTLSEIWIIDHSASTAEAAGAAGDFLYRWGNPGAYGRGGAADRKLFSQHDVRWIPDGWEGAGNLMVFNNGSERPDGSWSSIDEWTPPLGDGFHYALGEGPFAPTELAWQYRGKPPADFFAPFISGAQRLENGNTLIAAGTGGELYEVTRTSDIVWEYRSPFSGSVRNADGSMPQPGLDENPFALFRATRIPADHPALAGRTLAPLDPQPARFAWSKAP